ncbi:MAG TPA: DUF3043 domain-containing protein [Mycobacteriales bacterium]
MNPLKRKAPAPADVLVDDRPTKAGGKNAPTPKQREAREARARQLKAKPQSRKAKSAARRTAVEQTREALKSTDVTKLPKNEREPELIYTRDLVDTRRNLAGSVWIVAVIYFIGTTVAGSVRNNVFQTSILFLSLFWFLAMIVDAYLMAKQVDSRVRGRFPNTTVRVKGYAARRAFSLKRWRRPVPREIPPGNRWAQKD